MTRRYLLYALAVIFTANFLSYLDRQVVSALERELKSAYGLSKGEFGGLWTAFTVGYMVFAPIVGYLTDRSSRTRTFAVCVFLWSFATVASGLAPNKFVLYATRFFIGIGEAGCLVIGPTLLSDYFSKEVRGKALSVFFLALPLGGTAGYVVSGWVTQITGNWQNAFYVAGLPGFAVAALVWFLVDPPRGAQEEAAGPHGAPPAADGEPAPHGIRPYLELLRNRTLLYIILAQAFAVVILVPLLHFGVRFFEIQHRMTKGEATVTLGMIALVAGALGSILSGVIGDRLAKRTKGAYAILAAVGYGAGLPFLIVGFSSDSKWVFIPALMIGAFCYFLCMPAVNTQIANAVSARQRAMAYALAVFILHLLGDTAAPILFGTVADAKMEPVLARPADYPKHPDDAEEILRGVPLVKRFPAREWSARAEEAQKPGWTPKTTEEREFKEVVGTWQKTNSWAEAIATRGTFLLFAFSLLFSAGACLLAARHAARQGLPPPATGPSSAPH